MINVSSRLSQPRINYRRRPTSHDLALSSAMTTVQQCGSQAWSASTQPFVPPYIPGTVTAPSWSIQSMRRVAVNWRYRPPSVSRQRVVELTRPYTDDNNSLESSLTCHIPQAYSHPSQSTPLSPHSRAALLTTVTDLFSTFDRTLYIQPANSCLQMTKHKLTDILLAACTNSWIENKTIEMLQMATNDR